MPPKDDDDPESTKEVVTKKQKQLLNREELNLAAIAEAFGGLLLEAPAKKGSGKGSDLPFKEPEPDPVSKKDAKKLQRMTRASGPAAERIQRGLESQEKLSKTRKTRSSAQTSKYQFDPKTGAPTRKSVETYATRLTTRGYGDAGYDPSKRGVSDPAGQAKGVRDTFAAADRGDAKAKQQVQKWTDALTKKHGPSAGVTEPRGGQRIRSRSTGQTRRTRTSADRGLRDMQGRKGQAPLDPELQRAASRRAGQVPDEPTVGKPTVK